MGGDLGAWRELNQFFKDASNSRVRKNEGRERGEDSPVKLTQSKG